MNKQEIVLTPEIFHGIYTNEKLRNAIAYAHKCEDKFMTLKHYKARMYPIDYIIPIGEEHFIELAKNEIERAKMAKIESLEKGQLFFVGMGMNYENERYPDDVKQNRIRTEFKDRKGKVIFLELSRTVKDDNFYVDYSIDRDLEEKRRSENSQRQDYYNYKCRVGDGNELFTHKNVLNFVNQTYGCNYKSVDIDNYTLRVEDFICFC